MSFLVSAHQVREALKHVYDPAVLCRWRDANISQLDLYQAMANLREELIEESGVDSEDVYKLEEYMDVVWGHVPSNRVVWSRCLRSAAGGGVGYADADD